MTAAARMATMLALCVLVPCMLALAQRALAADDGSEAYVERDARLVGDALAAMPAQRPGTVDLYAIGFAGDGTQDVFRNEAVYFDALVRQRLHARGVLTLVNHPDSVSTRPAPLATYRNLRLALDGLAARMDPREDVLLLYLTMHGTPDHELALYFPPFVDDLLLPEDLATLLADAGTGNRVVVVSACYSGGFIPALRAPDALVMTAARADRASFGCGSQSTVTWFGRAWLVEGLNRRAGLVDAFDDAAARIAREERAARLPRSHPQRAQGAAIAGVLARWQAQAPPGSEVDYPYPLDP